MFKYKLIKIREYIFIILTATIFFFSSTAEPNAKENIFIVDDIKIEEAFDVNFSREKFINKAFRKSFNKLLSNILLREDINKLKKLKLKQIKNLIYSFKILDERFKDGKYSARYVVTYNDFKINSVKISTFQHNHSIEHLVLLLSYKLIHQPLFENGLEGNQSLL